MLNGDLDKFDQTATMTNKEEFIKKEEKEESPINSALLGQPPAVSATKETGNMPSFLSKTEMIMIACLSISFVTVTLAIIGILVTAPTDKNKRKREIQMDETKKMLKMKENASRGGDCDDEMNDMISNMVSELDPDAPTRQNKILAPLDMEYEDRLLKQIFMCVRCGQFEKIEEICRNSGQDWRADTLKGWKLFHDRNVTSSREEDGGGGGEEDFGENGGIDGNLNRILWKNVCWKMHDDATNRDSGLEVTINPYELATYSALCGNVKGILPAINQERWHDISWAYTKTLIETKVETILKNNPSVYDSTRNFTHSQDPSAINLPEAFWRQPHTFEEIFEIIDTKLPDTNSIIYSDIDPSECTLYRRIIKLVILNDFNGLLAFLRNSSAEILTYSEDNLDSSKISKSTKSTSTHLLSVHRFLAHLSLVLSAVYRSISSPYEEEVMIEPAVFATTDSYIKNLMRSESIHLFIGYLKFLPEIYQTTRFCSFLRDFSGLDFEDRRICLVLALENNLNLKNIFVAFLEDSLSSAMSSDNSRDQLLGALDWILIPSYCEESLLQHFPLYSTMIANILTRKFLLGDDMESARGVLSKLPKDANDRIASQYENDVGKETLVESRLEETPRVPSIVKNILGENFGYAQYIESIHSFDQWLEHYQKSENLSAKFESLLDREKTIVDIAIGLQERVAAETERKNLRAEADKWLNNFRIKTENTAEILFSIVNFPTKAGWLTDDVEDESLPDDKLVPASIANLMSKDPDRCSDLCALKQDLYPRVVSLLVQVLRSAKAYSVAPLYPSAENNEILEGNRHEDNVDYDEKLAQVTNVLLERRVFVGTDSTRNAGGITREDITESVSS
ncbi:unnamed protein product [Gordionus sp. m RMFG-2023]